jgi:hypothetical protein
MQCLADLGRSHVEKFWFKILDLRRDLLASLFCAGVVLLMLANAHMFYADELPRSVLWGISALAVISFFLTAPTEEALKLQRPLPDGSLENVARGSRNRLSQGWTGPLSLTTVRSNVV